MQLEALREHVSEQNHGIRVLNLQIQEFDALNFVQDRGLDALNVQICECGCMLDALFTDVAENATFNADMMPFFDKLKDFLP